MSASGALARVVMTAHGCGRGGGTSQRRRRRQYRMRDGALNQDGETDQRCERGDLRGAVAAGDEQAEGRAEAGRDDQHRDDLDGDAGSAAAAAGFRGR